MQESFLQPEMDREGGMIYSVEECHFLVQETLDRLGRVKVRGEMNDVKTVRGQMAFFDLKDSNGKDFVVKCSIFGWEFKKYLHLIENGMEGVAVGKLRMYKNGSLSIVVQEVQPYGEGAWRKAFEALKKKLEAKGYFDESRKREIPQVIQRIGLITSEEAQGLYDFRQNLGNYGFKVFLYSVWLEGDRAEESIVGAFQWFNKNRPDLDVLVLIRGGGGFENLKVFNSEKIADAIASSRLPVITGIGHEKDESIADYVADKRLSTPTAVAAFLRTQREELIGDVEAIRESLQEKMQDVLEEKKHAINTQAERLHRGFGRVFEGFATLKQRLLRAHYTYEKQIELYFARVERVQGMLASLNPENVLQRGYSVVFTAEKKVVKDASQLKLGEQVGVRVAKGRFVSRVEEIQ